MHMEIGAHFSHQCRKDSDCRDVCGEDCICAGGNCIHFIDNIPSPVPPITK